LFSSFIWNIGALYYSFAWSQPAKLNVKNRADTIVNHRMIVMEGIVLIILFSASKIINFSNLLPM
jgi:hypothetical protein